MLALAKVEQLRQQGDAPVVDAEPVLRAVALDLAPLIAERQLEFDIATVPAAVRVHEWALRELTRNLLHNAVKHSPPGARLSLSLQSEAGEAWLTVEDEGPGIADDLRQRLFQPFSTAAAPGAASGSGLGLAICREIVASLGGSIAMDNRRPAGLRAGVRLPLARPAAANPA